MSTQQHNIIYELENFIAQNKGEQGWSQINLHQNVCSVIDSNHKFDDGLRRTLQIIYERYPEVANMSLEELTDSIPYPPMCKQFVIGTLEHQSYYFMYNQKNDTHPFILSSAADWTEDLNNILISCGMNSHLKNQKNCPIRILIPKVLDNLLINNKPRITLLELCIVLEGIHKFKVDVIDESDHLDHIVVLLTPIKQNNQQGGSKIAAIISDGDLKHVKKFKNVDRWLNTKKKQIKTNKNNTEIKQSGDG
jgi:hypothetical protein